jgi:hypothetical protein
MNEYKPFRCRCCDHHLALTDGVRLVLGVGAYSDEPIPLKCAACGRRSYWRPVKKVDIAVMAVYIDPVPA